MKQRNAYYGRRETNRVNALPASTIGFSAWPLIDGLIAVERHRADPLTGRVRISFIGNDRMHVDQPL